jgi:nucleoside-diphosphate-sugar epimerase
MNYLITGSSGFLGSNLTISLKNKDHKVYQCSRDSKQKNQIYFNLEENIYLDNEILYKIDILIHCAYSFDATSLKNSRKINVIGSENIFKLASKFKIKIIYISSISAFEGCSTVHGKVKLEIENIAKKFNAIIIRPGLIYSKENQGAMFGSLVNLVKKSPIIPLIDNGEQILYMCKLEILCDLIYVLSKQEKSKYEVITAANKEPVMFKELIKTIINRYNKKRFLIPFPSTILLYILKIVESCNIKLRFQSDSLISILKPNNNPIFEDLNSYRISFPLFKIDF